MCNKIEFSEVEKSIIEIMRNQGNLDHDVEDTLISQPDYRIDGNITFVIFETENWEFYGATKRNIRDENNEEIGRNIAFSRAVSKRFK